MNTTTKTDEAPNPDAGGSYVRNPETGELSAVGGAASPGVPPAEDDGPAQPDPTEAA